MYLVKILEKDVFLYPKEFGINTKRILIKKLIKDTTGICLSTSGYVIKILSIINISKGNVQLNTGVIQFKIKYKAIIFYPYVNEIIDSVIVQISKQGFMSKVGPLDIFVSHMQLPEDMSYKIKSNSFISDDSLISLKNGDKVRIKIIGTRFDAKEIFAIGTLKDNYLGPLKYYPIS